MRATLRTLHRYLGLLLVLPLLAQGVTGAILATEPLFHSTGTAVANPASADAILAAARDVVPDGLRATRYLPGTTVAPAEVWFSSPTDNGRRTAMVVRVNPATAAPLWPPEDPDGLLTWSRRLHHDFLLSDHGGRSIVGWVGVGLVLLSIMGIPIWWPGPSRQGRWRAAFTWSAAERGYRFHRRLHGAVGAWVVALLLVSGVTGAVLGFPQTMRGVLGVAPSTPRANWSETDAAAPVRKLDAALGLATARAPGTAPRVVFLPAATSGPMRVVLAPPGVDGMARAVVVTVDAAATRVLGTRDFRTMSSSELALQWVHDIHFGEGLGFVWRVLTIIAGLALPVFAITGTAMWLLRKRDRGRLAFARRATSPVGE